MYLCQPNKVQVVGLFMADIQGAGLMADIYRVAATCTLQHQSHSSKKCVP